MYSWLYHEIVVGGDILVVIIFTALVYGLDRVLPRDKTES